jgi:predicted peroxiredoxin
MKKLIFILLACLVFILISCKNEEIVKQKTIKDGAFIHISHGSDDLHRALMGLQMAEKMSEDRDVLVYFDISGIEIVLSDSEDFTYSIFPSSKTQLKKLLNNGVTLMACPGCLKAAGKSESDLIEGIKIADKDKFFNFTSGRILSIDY